MADFGCCPEITRKTVTVRASVAICCTDRSWAHDLETTWFFGDEGLIRGPDTPILPPLVCNGCGKIPETAFSRCAKCGMVLSEELVRNDEAVAQLDTRSQRSDWKVHRKICEGLSKDVEQSKRAGDHVKKHYKENVVQQWVVNSWGIISQMCAHLVQHRRELALKTHSFIYVAEAREPDLVVRILSVYRVSIERDLDAFTTVYSDRGVSTTLERKQDAAHRIFVVDCTNGINAATNHALAMPIDAVALRFGPPLTFELLIRFAEAGLATIGNTGISLGGTGWDATKPFPKNTRPDGSGVGFWQGQVGMFERKDGKCRFSPSPKTPFSDEPRRWIDVPDHAF